MPNGVRVDIRETVLRVRVTDGMAKKHVEKIVDDAIEIARFSPLAPRVTGRLVSALQKTHVGSNGEGAYASMSINRRIAPHALFVLYGTGAFATGGRYGSGHWGPYIVSRRYAASGGRAGWMKLSNSPLSGTSGFGGNRGAWGGGLAYHRRVSGQRPRIEWLNTAVRTSLLRNGHV